MAADVPCEGRSYVQTRFLATEDSSTLTSLVRFFVLQTYLAQKHSYVFTYTHKFVDRGKRANRVKQQNLPLANVVSSYTRPSARRRTLRANR